MPATALHSLLLVRLVRVMDSLKILQNHIKERELANQDVGLAFEMQFKNALELINIFSRYFDFDGYIGKDTIKAPLIKLTSHNKRDVFIVESLEFEIKEYVKNYPLDYSTYNQAIITTGQLIDNYSVKDKKLKRFVDRHLKNDIISILMKLFLYRELGLRTFANHQYLLAFDFYNTFKDQIRLMEIQLHSKTPIEKPKDKLAKYKLTEKIIVKDLAEKIWDDYDDENVLMNDTVVNIIIKNVPILTTTLNDKAKELLNGKLKKWLIQTNTVPPEITVRGSRGATSNEEKSKRDKALRKINKEMKADFEYANQYLTKTRAKITDTPTS